MADWDVAVIGGGPAGSTIATLLARRGLRVALFEKERFPRLHVGESLLPFCYPILEELGVLPEMSERFVRKPGVRFIDPTGSIQTTWCFGHVINGPSRLSFHVRRDEFDDLLLRNAARAGVTVHEECRVSAAELDEDGCGLNVSDAGSSRTERARFLVDASGRDTFLAQRRLGKLADPHLDRVALSTHWGGIEADEALRGGLLQICYLGGDKQGWIWVIPVGPERVSIGVVLNHAHVAAARRRLEAAGVAQWRDRLYMEELESSGYVAGLVRRARPTMPLMSNGDYSYSVKPKFGARFALVGDAGAFIDPIFASGVYLAMNSARIVAPAIERTLSDGTEAGDAALRAAYDRIDGAYRLVDRAIRLFYDPNTISFARLGAVDSSPHRRHAYMMAVGHYLLAGDFFDKHRRYHAFLDMLESPAIATAYQALVMDRFATDQVSCLESDDRDGMLEE